MGQPHKHAELIKQWAEGAEIQSRRTDIVFSVNPPKEPEFQDDKHPTWAINMEYRIKPEPPKYPQTKMTDQELTKFWCDSQHGQYVGGCLRTVANAAIARAIEDGNVVPAAMLEKVAEAVRKEFYKHIMVYSYGAANYSIDKVSLEAIIAKVKEGK